MDAMILAAGLGTRLKSLTRQVPKALVDVGGKPLLQRVLERLARTGADRIIVNLHHHAQRIEAFVEEQRLAEVESVEIVFSREPDGPYETGGGLLHARELFTDSGPFILHNVDVLSTIPLGKILENHRSDGRGTLLASLAVQRRPSRRLLLFDDNGLMGWENRGSDRAEDGRHVIRDPVGSLVSMAFTGIHVIEPAIFQRTRRSGRFSIITLYLELAAAGFCIRPIDVTDHWWLDVGTPERLAEARARYG